MSLHALRTGHHVRIGATVFLIVRRLPEGAWQLQNTATGEWRTFDENSLLDQFATNDLSFVAPVDEGASSTSKLSEKLNRDLSVYASELVDLAKNRLQYLKEIDRQQPISITRATIEPITRAVADRIKDNKPPGWRTVCRNYQKWLAAGRDIRAIILRHADRGKPGTRLAPEVKAISDQVIQELYMTAERKRVLRKALPASKKANDRIHGAV
jgi:hypothetical protein